MSLLLIHDLGNHAGLEALRRLKAFLALAADMKSAKEIETEYLLSSRCATEMNAGNRRPFPAL